jgi:hypothetical protein
VDEFQAKRIAAAEQQLRDALTARDTSLAQGRVEEGLFAAVSAAQRALAAAKGEEYAVPFDIGVVPEAAVSEAMLLQTEDSAVLTFSGTQRDCDGRMASVGYAVVELERCVITKFGYPNDEARPGHPLAERGLDSYGVFEVVGSRWVKGLTLQNRKIFPKTEESTQRHFIFAFHDSTFECVAAGVRASVSTEPIRDTLSGLLAKLLTM